MLTLDQRKNFQADFGLVFRSSAIFAVFPEANLTISILNYWQIKNSLEVALVATCRDRSGTMLSRHQLEFTGQVVNFVPPHPDGSVEIEAFGSRNLRIPYAAIMGIYETDQSVSMVHAYARNHSNAELEDGLAVLEGREACMSVAATPAISTSSFFHNGNLPMPAQRCRMIVTNAAGEELTRSFELAAIASYQTVRFDFSDIVPELHEHLAGGQGWAAIHFANRSAFPRMLVRWLDRETGEVQVAHSNFDYSEFRTNLLAEAKRGFFCTPDLTEDATDGEIVVYPRCTAGTYDVVSDDARLETTGGAAYSFSPARTQNVRIERTDGPLPSRIVTAIRGRAHADSLPFECSVGTFHHERPEKRFHWGAVSARLESAIYLTKYPELYGQPDKGELSFALYGPERDQPIKRTLTYANISDIPERLPLEELFPDARNVLGEDPGYITLFSPWGGLIMFTSMRSEHSLTLEHSF